MPNSTEQFPVEKLKPVKVYTEFKGVIPEIRIVLAERVYNFVARGSRKDLKRSAISLWP